MKKNIDSRVYDRNILAQGIEFQIDKYYEPKEISMRRRIGVVLEALKPERGEKILDIGCGVGAFAFHTAKRGALSFGIDYSYESIKIAVKLVGKFSSVERCRLLVSDAISLPFKEASFDKVVAVDFIEHITSEEKDKLLREIRRVLKPEGIGLIFTPNGIREKIGEVYWKCRHFMFGDKIPTTDLHFGLTNRYEFEPLLKKYKFNFRFAYKDITRPYLAKIPLIRIFLSLNLLWIFKRT